MRKFSVGLIVCLVLLTGCYPPPGMEPTAKQQGASHVDLSEHAAQPERA